MSIFIASHHHNTSFSYLHWFKKINVMVEWLTFLLRTREIPGSNLGPETSFPDYGFS
jgi:hypothetical protein